jgi:cytochrome c peroxidase
MQSCKLLVLLIIVGAVGLLEFAPQASTTPVDSQLDQQLAAVLSQHDFTGNLSATLTQRLGRQVNRKLAHVGRLLWFDSIMGLNNDNSCSGCHWAPQGFSDTQSIAIGIENNGIVGPNRRGPRNNRRAPMMLNTAFYPNLMWNSRVVAVSGDPFDNSDGFKIPGPDGFTLSFLPHLLAAQALSSPTEITEMVGFHFMGDNTAIRKQIAFRLNRIPEYRELFGEVFPEVHDGGPITFPMIGLAIAEFQFTLTFADAPIDMFARGDTSAMTEDEKRGALLFFGKARCVTCHAVSGKADELFSDFEQHVIGVPQIAPLVGNVTFDGPRHNEDFGVEQNTQDSADRYKFRTSPLRNTALQLAFFHNGSFTLLEDAIRHHLNVFASARNYTNTFSGLDADLTARMGPVEPVLARVDPLIERPISLSQTEFRQLVAFVRHGLLDPRATPDNLRKLIPGSVPSGRPVPLFR